MSNNYIFETAYFRNEQLGIGTDDPQTTLDVSGEVLISGNSKINGNLELLGNFNGTNAKFNNIDISNNLIVKGNTRVADISGNDASFNKLDISTNLFVNGNSTIQDIVGNDASFNNINTYNNFIVHGYTTLQDIIANDVLFNSLDILANIIVNGNTKVNDISGNDASFNNIDVSSNLTVKGTTTFQNIFGKDSSFNNIDVSSNLTVNGTTSVQNMVGKDASFNNLDVSTNLLVKGDTTIQDILGKDASFNSINTINLKTKDISLNKIGSFNDVSKNIFIEGNLIPGGLIDSTGNSIYSLGTLSSKWKDLYLSGDTLFIGNSKISLNVRDTKDNNGVVIKKAIELLFVPDITNESGSDTNNGTNAIKIAGGEFKIETTIDSDGNIITSQVPIEDSFTTSSFLNLSDVDISKNKLQDGDLIIYDSSNEKFVIGSGSYVNNASQTFEEVLTQQPQKFNLINSESTTGSIRLNWSYDDILYKDNSGNNQFLSSAKLLKEKMIPFIDKIHLDISGTIPNDPTNINNKNWINYNIGIFDNDGNKTINENDSYDSDNYKFLEIFKVNSPSSDIEKILSESGNPISFRVYGINNSYDNSQNQINRSIYFHTDGFLTAQPPDVPTPATSNFETVTSTITLNYNAGLAEAGNSSSIAKIIKTKIEYQEIGREVSTHLNVSQTNTSNIYIQEFVQSNIPSGGSLSQTITNNLRVGTKYKYRISAKNDLNNNFSSPSQFENGLYFTNPPESTLSNSLSFTDNSTKTFISSTPLSNLNNTSAIYINIGSGNDTDEVFKPLVNSSDSSDFQLTSDTFYGKMLDDESDLANIKIYINGNNDASQNAVFNGYDTNSNSFNDVSNVTFAIDSSQNPFYFINISTNDIFSGNNDKQGFKLKGIVNMVNIKRKDITSLFGDPSGNSKTIKYEYTRNTTQYPSMGGNNSNKTFSLYIDNLSSGPEFTNTNDDGFNGRPEPTISISSDNIKYNMGIPSVKQFSLTFSRRYKNINSSNMFIPGDRKIADIQVNKYGGDSPISETAIQNIYLDRSKIENTGIYDLSNTEFLTATYHDIYYTRSILLKSNTGGNKLEINENIYSLFGSYTPRFQLKIVNNFYDKDSFNLQNSKIEDTKLKNLNLKELNFDTTNDNIIGFGNLNTLTVTDYNDHTIQIKKCTLLFIGGKFNTNAGIPYPIQSNFSWYGSINNPSSTDLGSSSYNKDTNGSNNSSNEGYKWICFDIGEKNLTDLATDGTNKYFDVYSYLNAYFSDNAIKYMRGGDTIAANNEKVVTFVRVIFESDDSNRKYTRVGNLQVSYDGNNIWYGSSQSDIDITQLSNSGRGCLFEPTTGSEWGIALPGGGSYYPINIEIFVGLKNSVSI